MDHIEERELVLFAFDPKAVPEERRAAIEQHIAVCADCRALRDFLAVTEEDLADPDVWERSIGSATRDSLMTYAAQIGDEDAEAEELLAPLFASPIRTAWMELEKDRRYRTGGVARRLSTHAHSICENEPLEALTFADAAITVAEALPDDLYPANAVYEIRGTAWKERANAQMLLGDFAGAHDSLSHAEHAYRQLASPALGLAAVALVRAGVLYQQDRFSEAAAAAEVAERSFTHLGDEERRMSALYLRGCISHTAHEPETAIDLFLHLIAYAESINSPTWKARAALSLGFAEIDRGNLAEASMHLQQARALYREVGGTNERARTEWGVGRLLLHAGKHHEAIRRLSDVAADFEHLGMFTDAALVGLDTADALLALGRSDEIIQLATHLFAVFTGAGMLTSALTALAHIKESAAAGTLTRGDVEVVRSFLRRVERQPELLFVPPPRND